MLSESFTSYKQTEIGIIPEDWPVIELEKVTSFISDGKHGDCTPQRKSGFYFLSAKDVFDGKLNYSDAREITKEDFIETNKRTRLEPGDILLSNSGTIGRLAIADDSEKIKCTTFQKSVALLKPCKCIDSHFLYYYLLANVKRVQETAGGTTQQNLLLKDLRAFKIALPKLEIQKEQVRLLKIIDSKIESNNQINSTLEAIGKAVFKRWFVDFEFSNQEGKPYKSSGGEMVYSKVAGKTSRKAGFLKNWVK